MMSIISGIVRDPVGRPIAQARVYFMNAPASLPDIAALTNNEGVFSLSAPSDGTYQIGIAADRFEPTSVTAAVMQGQEIKLEIKLNDLP